MANHTGASGTIKIGTDAIAEVRSWSLEEQADTIDCSIIGTSAKIYKAGQTGWSGSLTCYWDETDTNGQMTLVIGASIALELYPEGSESTDTYYTGDVYITGVSRSGAHDGMVEATYSFQGTGACTESTVS